MIPKVIHYCWFGGAPLPEEYKKYIETWKKFCPDYKIIQWDESNYDVHKNKYMEQAYDLKKWGFVPDYARFDIIYQHGGIYLDTDVEVLKSFDLLLNNRAYMGFEGGNWVNGGIGFGAEAGNLVIKGLRDMYDELSFVDEKGELNLTPSPYYITDFLVEHGLKRNNQEQLIDDSLCVYPIEYFAAKDYETGKIVISENTFSIHQYSASWFSPKQKLILKLKKVMGKDLFNKISKIRKSLK